MTKPTGNPRGSPSKARLAEVQKKPVGRPRTDVQHIVNEYRDRMLASPKSAKVLEKVFEVALSDGHPHQLGAMKLVMDRIVPASAFDTAKQQSGVPHISINITGLNGPTVEAVETIDNVVDVEDWNG